MARKCRETSTLAGIAAKLIRLRTQKNHEPSFFHRHCPLRDCADHHRQFLPCRGSGASAKHHLHHGGRPRLCRARQLWAEKDHTTFYRQQQHFFDNQFISNTIYFRQNIFHDNKLIYNTFLSPTTSFFLRQQHLSQQFIVFFPPLLSLCQAHFSTKIEVSALSWSVFNRNNLSTQRLTLNRFRFRAGIFWHISGSAFWVFRLKHSLLGKEALSLPTALLPLFQQHKSRELQP